jgi:uncharacterized protein YybS (DUF2232 family)
VGFIGSHFFLLYLLAGFMGFPLSMYIYQKGKEPISLFAIGVVVVLLGFFQNPIAAISLCGLILIPSFLCGIFYKKQVSIPENIIIVTISYFIGWISLFILLRWYYGMNVISEFYTTVQYLEQQILAQLSSQQQMMIENLPNMKEAFQSVPFLHITEEELLQSYAIRKILIKEMFFYVQRLFPTILFLFYLFCAFANVLITKLILSLLKWKSPSIKQMIDFGVSRLAAVLFVLTWIIGESLDESTYPVLTMAFENIIILFSILMFVLGILFLIYLLSHLKVGTTLKVLLTITGVIWIVVSPLLFVIIGFLETVFNFRKAKQLL